MPDLATTIETAAGKPAAASTDAGSATAHKLTDLVAADEHLSQKAPLSGTNDNGGPKSGWRCLRIARAVPGN